MLHQIQGIALIAFIIALALARSYTFLNLPLLIIIFFVTAWFAVAWLLRRLVKPTKPKYKPIKYVIRSYPKSDSNSNKYAVGRLPDDFVPTSSINRPRPDQLEREIRSLVKDDNAVDRLLASAKFKYPDKSHSWIVDKVLSDWLRDRS
jgi:hypothetical protein